MAMNPPLVEGARERCREQFLFASNGHVLSGLIVSPDEAPCVRIAVEHLERDLRALTTLEVPRIDAPEEAPCALVVATLGTDSADALGIDTAAVAGQREAYLIERIPGRPHVLAAVGADALGTRRALYRIGRWLGMDPMAAFTGFTPGYRPEVGFAPARIVGPTPTVRWRGVFINDEERIKTWFTEDPYDVADEAWERLFETVVRTDGNLLAPPMLYTDYMPPAIRQRCHDYGIAYTASHMEMLLFNPQCPARPGHWPDPAEVPFDWLKERDRMEAAWRDSIRRHKGKLSVWPLGVRGATDDAMANADLSPTEQARLTEEVIDRQVALLKDELAAAPGGEDAPMSITLYKEVLDLYNTGELHIPPEAIVVWADDNYGRVRRLPTAADREANPRNGLYYHVGYCRSQWTPFVGAHLIAQQLGKALRAGCTDLVLVNVGDGREFVHGWRAAMAMCTDPDLLEQGADAAAAGLDADFWRTYVGEPHTPRAVALWRRLIALIYRRIPYWHMLHADETLQAMKRHLDNADADFTPPEPISRDAETGPPFGPAEWDAYDAALDDLAADLGAFIDGAPRRAQAVLHDQMRLYLVIAACVNRWVRGVLEAAEALAHADPRRALARLEATRNVLAPIDDATDLAGWGPFETWYRGDWHTLYTSGAIPMDQTSWTLHPGRSRDRLDAVVALLRNA